MTNKPNNEPHTDDGTVRTMWAQVYSDTTSHWTPYELAEKLVDLEDYFRRCCFNHATTMEQVIGFKRGTGGVDYLKMMLAVELFLELWHVRTDL